MVALPQICIYLLGNDQYVSHNTMERQWEQPISSLSSVSMFTGSLGSMEGPHVRVYVCVCGGVCVCVCVCMCVGLT